MEVERNGCDGGESSTVEVTERAEMSRHPQLSRPFGDRPFFFSLFFLNFLVNSVLLDRLVAIPPDDEVSLWLNGEPHYDRLGLERTRPTQVKSRQKKKKEKNE